MADDGQKVLSELFKFVLLKQVTYVMNDIVTQVSFMSPDHQKWSLQTLPCRDHHLLKVTL